MMTLQERIKIKNEIVLSMDINGLLFAKSENSILFTVQFYILCKYWGIYYDKDRRRLAKAVLSLARRDDDGEIICGLFNRRPNWDSRKEQHDNYIGHAVASYLGVDFAAIWICEYGWKHGYVFNNVVPGRIWDLRFARFPFDILIYKICAEEWISLIGLFGAIHFYGKIWFTESKKVPDDTSSKLVSYVRMHGIKHKWYMKPLVKKYNKYITEMYVNGVEDLFKYYHHRPESANLRLLAKGVREVIIEEDQGICC